eukprot:GHVL01006073.1.p2 GENE.GHVL01006073.1~~GHVL01006073.1.p2  ORF type:complete len:440 (+),score=157.27 GHVL01006073.1:2279-3598(+)
MIITLLYNTKRRLDDDNNNNLTNVNVEIIFLPDIQNIQDETVSETVTSETVTDMKPSPSDIFIDFEYYFTNKNSYICNPINDSDIPLNFITDSCSNNITKRIRVLCPGTSRTVVTDLSGCPDTSITFPTSSPSNEDIKNKEETETEETGSPKPFSAEWFQQEWVWSMIGAVSAVAGLISVFSCTCCRKRNKIKDEMLQNDRYNSFRSTFRDTSNSFRSTPRGTPRDEEILSESSFSRLDDIHSLPDIGHELYQKSLLKQQKSLGVVANHILRQLESSDQLMGRNIPLEVGGRGTPRGGGGTSGGTPRGGDGVVEAGGVTPRQSNTRSILKKQFIHPGARRRGGGGGGGRGGGGRGGGGRGSGGRGGAGRGVGGGDLNDDNLTRAGSSSSISISIIENDSPDITVSESNISANDSNHISPTVSESVILNESVNRFLDEED